MLQELLLVVRKIQSIFFVGVQGVLLFFFFLTCQTKCVTWKLFKTTPGSQKDFLVLVFCVSVSLKKIKK